MKYTKSFLHFFYLKILCSTISTYSLKVIVDKKKLMLLINVVGSVVEWLKHRTYDQHDLG